MIEYEYLTIATKTLPEDQEYSWVRDMYFDTKSRPENQAMTGTELLK